jgi:hypothetical protein
MTTAANDNSQYIIRVTAEQFKNVKVIDFVPNRYVTTMTGPNGAGKTSVLDAVFHALLGRKTLPANLIRQGQKKGFIRIETNTHIVTRHLDEKGGDLQIEQKATGTLVKAPDDWLEGIAGDLGFDPLKFMRLKPEEQFAALKSLVPMDADVDDLETRNENDAETITRRKAEAKRLEAARDHIVIDKTLAAEPINIEKLMQEANAIEESNRSIREEQQSRDSDRRQRDGFIRTMEERTKQINRLRAEMDTLENENKQDGENLGTLNDAINGWTALPPLQDRRELDERISAASATNSTIATNNANKTQRDKFEQDVDAIKVEVGQLEEQVRARKLTIAATLGKAKFPIPGLSFETVTEGSSGRERKNPKKIITYRGVPLSEASSAEQIRISTAIGMANKPDLRFLLIREGSLLDDNGLAILEQMAHENSYQILMEKVDTSGKVGIFMEDGTIKTVNPEAETAAEPKPKKATRKAKDEKQGELIK